MNIRTANERDLPAIVRLLSEDALGSTRELVADPLPVVYTEAFANIQAQRGNAVLVAETDGEIIACLQLTFIPGLARKGMLRAQIEGVRVDGRYRGRGIGEQLFRHAIDAARREGCGMVQLTTDKSRADARRFYEKLGFAASHEGMKLMLI
ncbi:GNAT family N-acetyltransferase [Paenibacillus methanolicus]|uniref:Ribosomal protein S18 acetylase RimI-like enzyme n=1 Tax=Paenibacillus methanolicus TaxID=582686 RepID=A0A5S5C6B8_9BACL|nr:GNAT family N-acetyltransferase [Paenibacillus methanolicus]TYP74894.1 ribosomal protein S18 acetylase RimI-like enzyme [Paenibacillus methanolicus]